MYSGYMSIGEKDRYEPSHQKLIKNEFLWILKYMNQDGGFIITLISASYGTTANSYMHALVQVSFWDWTLHVVVQSRGEQI